MQGRRGRCPPSSAAPARTNGGRRTTPFRGSRRDPNRSRSVTPINSPRRSRIASLAAVPGMRRPPSATNNSRTRSRMPRTSPTGSTPAAPTPSRCPSVARMRRSGGKRRRVHYLLVWIHFGNRPERVIAYVIRTVRHGRHDHGESILLIHIHAMERRVVEQPVEHECECGGPRAGDRELLPFGCRSTGLLFRDCRGRDHRRFGPRRGGLSETTSAVRASAPAAVGFPLVKATKRARDRLRRRMLVIPNERIVRKDFYYFPLWRVEAEVASGGRTEGRAVRQFYVNAVTGELGHVVYGRLTFEEIPPKDAVRLEPLVAESVLEHVTAETVNDPIPIAKVGPSQAQEIVRTTLGAKPTETEPELVLLPMWRFDVRSNGAGRGRTMWMEGTFGSVFDKSP